MIAEFFACRELGVLHKTYNISSLPERMRHFQLIFYKQTLEVSPFSVIAMQCKG